MMSWAHARFRNRLISKAEEFGKIVITSVSEAYTSKTWIYLGEVKYLGVIGVDFRLIEI